MRPTIYDVAARTGVSVTTVSRVLNGASGVHPTTQDRVMRAIRELDYAPRAAARALGSQKVTNLGLIVPDVRNPFFAEVVHWTTEAVRREHFALVVTNAGHDGDVQEHLDLLRRGTVAGMLVSTAAAADADIGAAAERGLPIVLVARDTETSVVPAVVTDDVLGGQLAARHLLQEGHQRFAVVTEPLKWKPAQDRVRGFLSEVRKDGRGTVQEIVAEGFGLEAGYQACAEQLGKSRPPTAIFATTDMLALGVLRWLTDWSFNVPEEVSVVGYDGTLLGALANPPLTTVRQPLEEMVRTAVATLLELVAHPERLPRKVVLPPSLVLRQSTRTKHRGYLDSRSG